MKTVLILGAGRSASTLIAEMLTLGAKAGWEVQLGDLNADLAAARVQGHANGSSFTIDAGDTTDRDRRIHKSDLVISMVPAFLHPEIARVCIEAGVSLITPSYIGAEMAALDGAAREKGVLLLNEIGLDPGIDHMSAMEVIHGIRARGGVVEHFESYCGGLVAPESDTNPWHYKISWNPRNVVCAGQGSSAIYLKNGRTRLLPPHRVFQEIQSVEVGGLSFEGYANRDSVAYKEVYELKHVKSLVRGTLRGKGYAEAWDVLVQLGCVGDVVELSMADGASWNDWIASFVGGFGDEVRARVQGQTGASEKSMGLLDWLGVFDQHEGPDRSAGTAADFLQELIEVKWELLPGDLDMVVMWHRFEYVIDGVRHETISSFRRDGRDDSFTAMADTVGLPMVYAAEMMLADGFNRSGVEAPMDRVYYEAILPRLADWGIQFDETHRVLEPELT